MSKGFLSERIWPSIEFRDRAFCRAWTPPIVSPQHPGARSPVSERPRVELPGRSDVVEREGPVGDDVREPDVEGLEQHATVLGAGSRIDRRLLAVRIDLFE